MEEEGAHGAEWKPRDQGAHDGANCRPSWVGPPQHCSTLSLHLSLGLLSASLHSWCHLQDDGRLAVRTPCLHHHYLLCKRRLGLTRVTYPSLNLFLWSVRWDSVWEAWLPGIGGLWLGDRVFRPFSSTEGRPFPHKGFSPLFTELLLLTKSHCDKGTGRRSHSSCPQVCIIMLIRAATEMAQPSKALAAFMQDQSSVPSIHSRCSQWLVTPVPGDLMQPSNPAGTRTHLHIPTTDTHLYKGEICMAVSR